MKQRSASSNAHRIVTDYEDSVVAVNMLRDRAWRATVRTAFEHEKRQRAVLLTYIASLEARPKKLKVTR